MSRSAFALLATYALTGVAHAADLAPANTPGSIPVRITVIADLDDYSATLQWLQPAQLTEPHGWYRVLATEPAARAIPAGPQCRMAS